MLGINVSDAVAIGSLLIALLAAYKGAKTGEVVKKLDGPNLSGINEERINGATVLGREAVETIAKGLSTLSEAVVKLTAVIEDYADKEERDNHERLSRLLDHLEHPHQPPGKR